MGTALLVFLLELPKSNPEFCYNDQDPVKTENRGFDTLFSFTSLLSYVNVIVVMSAGSPYLNSILEVTLFSKVGSYVSVLVEII